MDKELLHGPELMRSGSDIADWLRRLDLMQYEQVFRDNAVDIETSKSSASFSDIEKRCSRQSPR